jgi:proteasome lid subunit RPN8/RPN11
MNEDTRSAALAYAQAEFPREACGLVVVVKGKERFWPCRNISDLGGDQFIMDPEDYAAAEREGEIVAIFHSHVNLPPLPSEADKVACEATGLKWYIVGIPNLMWAEFEPTGYEAPLVGRVHCWGTLDCWTIVRDWYRRERGIELINLPRAPNFWKRGENILGDNYKRAGFVAVPEDEPLEVGDVILMQTGDSPFPNHVALYIGDDIILHHAENRLSSRDVYGGWYKKHTVKVVRYANGQA